MIRFILFFIAFEVAIPFYFYGQQYEWKQKSDYGGGEIYAPFWFVIGDKAYVGGGRQTNSTIRKDFWEFDPVQNMWTQKADYGGSARYGAMGFAIGNYGFAGTGWTPASSTDFYKYDPATNVWTQAAPFGGTGRYTSTTFAVGGYGYLGLGYSPCKKDFWRYNDTSNTWSQVANFPGYQRQAGVGFVIGDYAYVGTGLCPDDLYSDFYRYSYASNSWTAIAPFPGPMRNAAFSFVINKSGYVLMGFDYLSPSTNVTVYNDMWEYNSLTDEWIQLSDFPGKGRFEGFSFSINGKGYIGVGADTAFSHFLSEVWEYGPVAPIPGHTGSIHCDLDLYPNPTKSKINVHAPQGYEFMNGDKLEFINSRGRLAKVLKIESSQSSFEIPVPELDKGVYVLQMRRDRLVVAKCKFVKI